MRQWVFRALPKACRQIAVLSDIHANGPALQAVLANVPAGACLVCLGDLVGYYTEPEEVCRAVRSRADLIIRGNHDAYVIGAIDYPATKESAYRVHWTRDHLSRDTREWLGRLPTEAAVEAGGGASRFLFRHANLEDEVGYVYPDTRLDGFDLEPGITLVLGHTHHPMLRRAGRGWVLNSGSVGQPRDYRPGAAYALIDVDTGMVTFRRVAYDILGYQSYLRQRGINELFVAMLARQKTQENGLAIDDGAFATVVEFAANE